MKAQENVWGTGVLLLLNCMYIFINEKKKSLFFLYSEVT